MAYADLTAEQKALLDNYANNLRASLGSLARLVEEAGRLQNQYNEEVSPIITAWNTSDPWPNKGGLAGASITETKGQMVDWQSYLDTLKTSLGTAGHMGQYISAAGPDNVRG